MYAHGKIVFCMQEYAGCPNTARVHVGTTFFRGAHPPKNQIKMQKESIEMQEELVCTYLVQEKVHFIL
jgi:hypothetical protein